MTIELLIQNGSTIYYPIVEEGICLELERKNVPGKLTFTLIKDDLLNVTEGNAVSLKVDGTGVFYGFIFSKQKSKGTTIKVTAYDQLRYLKNKDTYVYANKTAGEVIKMLANDFRLQTGTIEDTGFKIESRVEDNKTLFDIIQNALDMTLMNNKSMYVLYDDFGKLTLKNTGNMKLNLLIDEETGEDFDYTSSIDSNTYNKVKLTYDNKKTGKREVYISQDSTNMNNWGVLQFFETIDEKVNGKAKSDALLSLYNKKTKNLSISDAIGDIRVRGGSLIVVKLTLDDVKLENFMLVEKVKHTFNENNHKMTLSLKGGEFVV